MVGPAGWPAFDLVIVETSGIGQGNAAIVPHVDLSLYVMTPSSGAASQLEKIDMLDFADFVAINKFDRSGAEDALRDVRKQYQRNHGAFSQPPERDAGLSHGGGCFNDEGVTASTGPPPRLEQARACGPNRAGWRGWARHVPLTTAPLSRPAAALPGGDRR